MLFKFRKIDSPSCYFCEDEPEILEHSFFSCSKVRVFWEEVNLLLNSKGMMYRSFNFRDILLGFLAQSVMKFYLIIYCPGK